jgi:hypothetical protein
VWVRHGRTKLSAAHEQREQLDDDVDAALGVKEPQLSVAVECLKRAFRRLKHYAVP